MRRYYSQRAARGFRKKAEEFERKYIALMRSFTGVYPGTHVRTIDSPGSSTTDVLNTVVRLGFPLAAKVEGSKIEFYALKP